MAGSEVAFVAIGAVGFLVLLTSALLGEVAEHHLEFDHHVELGHPVELGQHELGQHEVGQHELGQHGSVEVPPEVRNGVEGGFQELPAPSWLSVRVGAAALVGFGAVGFIAARAGLPALVSWPVAVAGFLAVGAGTYSLVLKPLARQQYNSLLSRYSYVGRDAMVTLAILPGGTGQVTFQDRSGARVTQTASSDLPDAVPKGVAVQIVDLAPNGVIVHHNTFL